MATITAACDICCACAFSCVKADSAEVLPLPASCHAFMLKRALQVMPSHGPVVSVLVESQLPCASQHPWHEPAILGPTTINITIAWSSKPLGHSMKYHQGCFLLQTLNDVTLECSECCSQTIRTSLLDVREKAYERSGLGSSYLFRIDESWAVDATRQVCSPSPSQNPPPPPPTLASPFLVTPPPLQPINRS